MGEGANEITEKELRQIEYEQICNDWRHRDSMLWQALAVAITLTGVVFVGAFSKDAENQWLFRTVIFFIAALLNFVIFLKISKDHYYQLGSSDLLDRLGSEKLKEDREINPDEHKDSLRIWEPSKNYFNHPERSRKIPFPCLYKWLSGRSAFKFFFGIQLVLLVITFAASCICAYYYFSH
jgi:hypothetical protein